MYSQERAKENKAQQVILVHPSTRATSSPLHHCKDFHYEKDLPDQFTKQSCNPQEYTAPCKKNRWNLHQIKNYTISTV